MYNCHPHHFLEIFKTQVNEPIGSYQIQYLKRSKTFDFILNTLLRIISKVPCQTLVNVFLFRSHDQKIDQRTEGQMCRGINRFRQSSLQLHRRIPFPAVVQKDGHWVYNAKRESLQSQAIRGLSGLGHVGTIDDRDLLLRLGCCPLFSTSFAISKICTYAPVKRVIPCQVV